MGIFVADMDRQTNPVPENYYEDRAGRTVFLSLAELSAAGGRVTRVRWLMERGRADLSYVHGVLPDGTPVHVRGAGVYLIPRWEMKKSLIEWARSEGVFAKELGLLDDANWSVLN